MGRLQAKRRCILTVPPGPAGELSFPKCVWGTVHTQREPWALPSSLVLEPKKPTCHPQPFTAEYRETWTQLQFQCPGVLMQPLAGPESHEHVGTMTALWSTGLGSLPRTSIFTVHSDHWVTHCPEHSMMNINTVQHRLDKLLDLEKCLLWEPGCQVI